jgi:hypothetical protein
MPKIGTNWRTLKLFDGLNRKSKDENNGRRNWGTLPGSQHFGGKGVCWSFGMGTKMIDK